MKSIQAKQSERQLSMNENLALIQANARAIWRHRWAGLVAAMFLCMVGWIVVFALPNQYEVAAKVFVGTNSMLQPLLKGLALESNSRADTALMVRRTLLSRPNLESVARANDMDLEAETPRKFEALIINLAEKITVSGTLRDNIFEIRYRSEDPELATRVVSSLLNLFVEITLGENRKDSNKTREFLDHQISEYEKKLEVAEARVKEFKQRNIGVMPSESRGYFSRWQAISDRLLASKLSLEEAKMRRDELRRQVEREKPRLTRETQLFGTVSEISPLEARIINLESRLDLLLLQYTDQHPDVMAARRMLQELKQEQQRTLTRKPDQDDNTVLESPAYQELKVALGQAEAEVAALEARVNEFSRRERNFEADVSTIPAVEAELARLNRDYEVNKTNYEELVTRRESLSLSEEANYTTNEVQFRIIEPPRQPLLPTSPDRERLSVLVFILGVAGGIGYSWLLAMLRPCIYTKEDFSKITNVPVLGVVSKVWTRSMRVGRRVEVASFCFGCLFLLSLFAGVYTIEALQLEIGSVDEILTGLKNIEVGRLLR